MSSRKDRRLFKDAKLREREALKLLKRARKNLDENVVATVTQAVDAVRIAREAKDAPRCKAAALAPDELVDRHLGRYRKSALREYSESIGLAVLFALILRAFVVEAFQIPSASMLPTLYVGDHLFVNKFVYGLRIPFTRHDLIRFRDPERGDVVVFIYPAEEVRTQMRIARVMRVLEPLRGRLPEALPELPGVEVNPMLVSDGTPAPVDAAVDDWGRPLRYERLSANEYRLTSLGRDGELGTLDDITDAMVSPGLRSAYWRRAEAAHGRPAGPFYLAANCLGTEPISSRDYIKRVIGLPGDHIAVRDGIPVINGVPLGHGASAVQPVEDQGAIYPIPSRTAAEVIDGNEHVVQFRLGGHADDFAETVVREGHIFVMGDNRDNSSDSRCWGQVPIDAVKGEALFIFWSRDQDERSEAFLGNRWGRMFTGVD
jgi:signal peptidase I